MKKVVLKPDWSIIDNHPTWSYINTETLSQILGVSEQSIQNYIHRGILCQPDPRPKGKGNKNFWNIARLKACLESGQEDEIHWDWIKRKLGTEGHRIKTLEQAKYLVKIAYDIFGVEKPIII